MRAAVRAWLLLLCAGAASGLRASAGLRAPGQRRTRVPSSARSTELRSTRPTALFAKKNDADTPQDVDVLLIDGDNVRGKSPSFSWTKADLLRNAQAWKREGLQIILYIDHGTQAEAVAIDACTTIVFSGPSNSADDAIARDVAYLCNMLEGKRIGVITSDSGLGSRCRKSARPSRQEGEGARLSLFSSVGFVDKMLPEKLAVEKGFVDKMLAEKLAVEKGGVWYADDAAPAADGALKGDQGPISAALLVLAARISAASQRASLVRASNKRRVGSKTTNRFEELLAANCGASLLLGSAKSNDQDLAKLVSLASFETVEAVVRLNGGGVLGKERTWERTLRAAKFQVDLPRDTLQQGDWRAAFAAHVSANGRAGPKMKSVSNVAVPNVAAVDAADAADAVEEEVTSPAGIVFQVAARPTATASRSDRKRARSEGEAPPKRRNAAAADKPTTMAAASKRWGLGAKKGGKFKGAKAADVSPEAAWPGLDVDVSVASVDDEGCLRVASVEFAASASCARRQLKFAFVSDTHGFQSSLGVLPAGDVFIHAGDFGLDSGKKVEDKRSLREFDDWLQSQDYATKIVVRGNHDPKVAFFGDATFIAEPQLLTLPAAQGSLTILVAPHGSNFSATLFSENRVTNWHGDRGRAVLHTAPRTLDVPRVAHGKGCGRRSLAQRPLCGSMMRLLYTLVVWSRARAFQSISKRVHSKPLFKAFQRPSERVPDRSHGALFGALVRALAAPLVTDLDAPLWRPSCGPRIKAPFQGPFSRPLFKAREAGLFWSA